MTSAVVIGSGPNGLAAAIRLAQEGIGVTVLEAKDRPGGGARTSELTLPGVLHDDCAGMHPTAVASPFLRSLPLAEHGLEWLWPDLDLAHPLDDGRAGVLSRDLTRTVVGLEGSDGPAWERLFGYLGGGFDDLVEDVFGPVLGIPHHPLKLARFGLHALKPATMMVDRWHGVVARSLYMGVAAHVFGRLDTPFSGSVGLMLTAAGHAVGWPVARGGTGSITRAMTGLLTSLGGRVECGVEVSSLDQLRGVNGAPPDVVMFDTNPSAVLAIVGDALPTGVRRALGRYAYGPAAYKIDFAIRGDVPWTNPDARRAGTVHLGGPAEEMVAVEAQTARGEMPERPFMLCGQQYLADPSRSADGVNPFYAYAHVPHAYAGDASEAMVAQIERFAPGFRDTIVETHVRGPAQLEAYNANYRGGDISAGANDWRQILLRPRPAVNPYRLGVPGLYLCSSATPPGAGVHGMGGYHAAETALARLR